MAVSQQISHRLTEAISHHEAGRFDRAEAIYRQVAVQAPRLALVFDLWGRLAEQQGRYDDAERHFQYALQLDPRNVSCAVQLCSVLIATSRAADAEKVMRKLTTSLPRSFDAWNALGFTLKIQGRLNEALECHQKAVTINPKFAAGWLHWGLTLMIAGRSFEALEKQERALALDPKLMAARFGRAQLLHKVYRTEEALLDYDAVVRSEPRNLDARSYRLFALQALDRLTPEQFAVEHRAYGEIVGRGPQVLSGYDYSPNRKLRVAVLSPDFRTHSCAYFIEPLLRGLDPQQFELYLYHDHFIEDAISARFRSYAAVWRNFVGQSALAFETAVRADKPDILIDLTGHVGNTIRLPSFAKRLAPVQITYLGYPDTTGVPAMDYRFTDAVADPVGAADALVTEKLVRFAPVAWTYQPSVDAPAVTAPPALRGGPVTFGCFSSPTKFTDALFAAWGRLLGSMPDARLLLKGGDFEHPAVRANITSRLQRQGVPLERVELLPRTPDTRSHLEQYSRVDIALDTFPYTGTTTTCEALWMGRPVVVLRGNRHAARVGASLLTALGRPEWIANSVEEYVQLAQTLVSDRQTLAQASAGLRAAMQASPMLDYAGQAACFARALRACWREKAGEAEKQP